MRIIDIFDLFTILDQSDDTTIFTIFVRKNRLSLNGGKKIDIFKNRDQQIKKINFRVSGVKINPTSLIKYLGVHLTHTLT